MYKKWLLWYLLFSFSLLTKAQIPLTPDSLQTYLRTAPKDSNYVMALNEVAFLLFTEGKYDEAITYVNKMETLTKKLNYGTGYYKILNMRGVISYGRQQYSEALQYFFKSLEAHKKYNTPKENYQNSLNNISIIYAALGDREKATKYAMELIDYQEKNKIEPMKTSPYDQIGDNLKFYKKYDEALAYYEKSATISARYKNYVDVAIGENKIGSIYDDMGKKDLAIAHYEKGLKIAEKEQYKQLQVDFLNNLGRMHSQMGNFATAEEYLKKSEVICIALKSNSSLRVLYLIMGKMYLSQMKYVHAEQYYLKSYEISKKIDNPEDKYKIAQALAELYAERGDYKKAYQYGEIADIAKDSIFKIETAQTVEDLLKKYETTQKEQQIALLSEKNGKSAFQNKALLIGISLLIVVLALLFWNLQTKRKTERIITSKNIALEKLNIDLEEANHTKAKLFGIIGHDLRTPVKQMYQFLKLQKLNVHNEQEKAERAIKMERATEQLLDTMEDLLFWSKTQMSELKPSIELVELSSVLQPVDQLLQLYIEEKNVQLKNNVSESIRVMADYNFLQAIYRNLLQNAIKASPPGGIIVVNTSAQNNNTTLSIVNSGNPFTQQDFERQVQLGRTSQSLNGLGLQLVQELSEKMNIAVLFTPSADGTITEVIFTAKC